MSQTSVSRAHEQPSQLKDYEATLKDQALDSGNSKHPSDAEKAPVEPETPSLGWEAWSTVVASWLIQFSGFGYQNAFGVYEDFYVREFLTSNTSSEISWIGSVQLFLLMGLGIVSGRLFDKGYFYHVFVTGSVLLVFCLFMLSLAKPGNYYQVFLSQGLGLGIASGLNYVPSIAILGHHFHNPHQRGLAMALAASGSSTGGIIHPIMLNHLFHGKLGFHNGVRASAGLVAGCLILALILIRPKYPKSHPSGKGHPPASEVLSKFLKDRLYLIAVSGLTMGMLGAFMPLFYLQLYAIKQGIDSTFAFYTITILNSASFMGRIAPGFVFKYLGVVNIIIICTLSCGILLFAMLGIKTLASVTVFAILFGFASGAYVSVMNPILALLSDHPQELGARMGFAFFFTGLAGLIGPPINGALLTSNFEWWRPIVFSGVIGFAAVVAFVTLRILLWKKRGESAKWVI